VQLTWLGEADLDLHLSRIVEGTACFNSHNAVAPQRQCTAADAVRDCSSRACDDNGDWNGDVYSSVDDDIFIRPHHHPTGQGAELIYLPGARDSGTADVAVEAVNAAGPVSYRLRIFHGRLSYFERTGVVFPDEIREVTTVQF
jgi:hypothetical protein